MVRRAGGGVGDVATRHRSEAIDGAAIQWSPGGGGGGGGALAHGGPTDVY